MLAGLDPLLRPGRYLFATVPRDAPVPAAAVAVFVEDEGRTLVLPEDEAARLGVAGRVPVRVDHAAGGLAAGRGRVAGPGDGGAGRARDQREPGVGGAPRPPVRPVRPGGGRAGRAARAERAGGRGGGAGRGVRAGRRPGPGRPRRGVALPVDRGVLVGLAHPHRRRDPAGPGLAGRRGVPALDRGDGRVRPRGVRRGVVRLPGRRVRAGPARGAGLGVALVAAVTDDPPRGRARRRAVGFAAATTHGRGQANRASSR